MHSFRHQILKHKPMYFSDSVQTIHDFEHDIYGKDYTTDCFMIGLFLLMWLKQDSISLPYKPVLRTLGTSLWRWLIVIWVCLTFLLLTYQKYSFTPPYPTLFFKFKVEESYHNVQDKEGNKNNRFGDKEGKFLSIRTMFLWSQCHVPGVNSRCMSRSLDLGVAPTPWSG